MAILVLCTVVHVYTVSHLTAVTALKQIDPEFESVSASLKVPFYKTFIRVTVPVCLPTILDIALYLFVNAVTTVSAVVYRRVWSEQNVGPAARALLARDEAVFLRQSLSTPCLSAIRRAEGIWIEDADGRRYMDFHGNSVHHLGHGHPRVCDAMFRPDGTRSGRDAPEASGGGDGQLLSKDGTGPRALRA